MATFNIVMPKLGESIQEATITKWFKKVGDKIEEEDVILEIATDKVDSEIPSPVDGVIVKILFDEGALVPVGEVIAVIDLDGNASVEPVNDDSKKEQVKVEKSDKIVAHVVTKNDVASDSGKFYSPLVKSIANKENISVTELDAIPGTGHNGRIRKQDVLT